MVNGGMHLLLVIREARIEAHAAAARGHCDFVSRLNLIAHEPVHVRKNRCQVLPCEAGIIEHQNDVPANIVFLCDSGGRRTGRS